MLTFDGLKNFDILTSDNQRVQLIDLLFDQEQLGIRYLVVSRGNILENKNFMISPFLISRVDFVAQSINLKIDHQEISERPEMLYYQPITRSKEQVYADSLMIPYYL